MFKRTITTLIALLFISVGLSACSSGSSDTGSARSTHKAVSVRTDEVSTISLDGKWKTSDDLMTANVQSGVISIFLKMDDGKGLYWKGTIPTSVEENAQFVSDADVEALSASILGSQDETKKFTYEDNALKFKFTALGVTKTVSLEK